MYTLLNYSTKQKWLHSYHLSSVVLSTLLLMLVWLLPIFAFSQELPPRSFQLQTAGSPSDSLSGNGQPAQVIGYSSITLSVVGTASPSSNRVVSFKGSATTDTAAAYTSISCANLSGLSTATSVTTSGATETKWNCPIIGIKFFRAPVSGGTTGTVDVVGNVLEKVTLRLPSIGGTEGADPTATIGLSSVNGSATTYMRSDAAPPLGQSISPTWSGNHTFTGRLNFPHSTTLPATCTIGDGYMDTDATSGSRWYLCETTNGWVAQGGSGTVTGTGISPNLAAWSSSTGLGSAAVGTSALPGLTQGSVLFGGVGGVLSQDNAGLSYTASTKRLALTGTSSSFARFTQNEPGVSGGNLYLGADQIGLSMHITNYGFNPGLDLDLSLYENDGYAYTRAVGIQLHSDLAVTGGSHAQYARGIDILSPTILVDSITNLDELSGIYIQNQHQVSFGTVGAPISALRIAPQGTGNVEYAILSEGGRVQFGAATTSWYSTFPVRIDGNVELRWDGAVTLFTANYINFGAFDGDTGFGFRNNSGMMECKNEGGSWGACQASPGGSNTQLQFNDGGVFGGAADIAYQPTSVAYKAPQLQIGNNIWDYTSASMTFGMSSLTGGATTLTLGDDEVSSAISLPFAFSFFGSAITGIKVVSNGFIYMGTSETFDGCCVGTTLPSPYGVAPLGMIAAYWNDLDPSAAGTVKYETLGTTPNRIFVVEFGGVPEVGGTGSATFQIKLFELDQHIEIHCQSCTSDNGTNYTQGMQNFAGIMAAGTTARFAAIFDLTNDARTFVPVSPGKYDPSGGYARLLMVSNNFVDNNGDLSVVQLGDGAAHINVGANDVQATGLRFWSLVNGVWEQRAVIESSGSSSLGLTAGTASIVLAGDGAVIARSGTGFGMVKADGSTGACLMLRDTDGTGWTKCLVSGGVLTCSIDADGVC